MSQCNLGATAAVVENNIVCWPDYHEESSSWVLSNTCDTAQSHIKVEENNWQNFQATMADWLATNERPHMDNVNMLDVSLIRTIN